jgi:hypothetical protein
VADWDDADDQADGDDGWQGHDLEEDEFDDFYLSRYGNPGIWGGDLEDDDYPVPDDGYDEYLIPDEDPEDAMVELAIAGAGKGRGDSGLSTRSRMNMRRLFLSLPWELCAPRPALISLTYPADWVRWVPNGRTWERHRKSFERRWVRRWSEPLVGVWVKEFQGTRRPHLHLYVGLPTAMTTEDFTGLRERTLLRHRLERQYGTYEGRKRTPPIGGEHGGEFGLWLRQAWSDVVGTKPYEPGSTLTRFERGGAHHARGADVAVMFWSDEAERAADRTKVADYLAPGGGKVAPEAAATWLRRSGPLLRLLGPVGRVPAGGHHDPAATSGGGRGRAPARPLGRMEAGRHPPGRATDRSVGRPPPGRWRDRIRPRPRPGRPAARLV